jgi:uncharacterized protein YukE
MKWIFTLLLLFPLYASAVESTPAQSTPVETGQCQKLNNNSPVSTLNNVSIEQCLAQGKIWDSSATQYPTRWNKLGVSPNHYYDLQVTVGGNWYATNTRYVVTSITNTYTCPPNGKPNFTSGPIDLNGSKVCQTTPKTCLMGAAVRIDKDGKETCVANCSAAAGLSNGGAVYYNGGADNTISADDVTCFGQCAVSATTLVQNAAGYYSGPFTFTGANCSVIRPEPVTGSDTAGLNETPVPVDNSNTSQGTQDSLDNLSNAASSSNSTEIDTPSTGANGESTIKDLQQTVKDSAIEQIKSNTSSASNLGNLLSNISNDLQNAIANSGGGGGNGNSSLQLQGNNKLDGINQTLQDISDKLDEPSEEEPPFTPPTSSPNFWENVLPDSSFNDIKSKTESAGQELKDMYEDFRSSIFVSDIAASGTAWADSFTKNGQTFELGSSWFEYAINHGFYAIVILLATMFAFYIVTSRGK